MSVRYSETYGLEAFRGRVVVMSFHAGWCSGCVVQAGLMQELFEDLRSEGYTELQFVSINATDAIPWVRSHRSDHIRKSLGPIQRDNNHAGGFPGLLGDYGQNAAPADCSRRSFKGPPDQA